MMTTSKEKEETLSEGFLPDNQGANDKTTNGDLPTKRDEDVLSRTCSRVVDHPWIDKGWAWMVSFAGLTVMFVCMGQIRNMGLLLAEVKINFSESTAVAAMLPSIVYLIMPMMSPISSILTSHYGSRPVVLAGVIITVSAHISIMFATNVTHILIFYAIPLAIGTGLCYTATVVIIGSYFHKRTSLGLGLATSGAPIAGILLPTLYTYLSSYYGFKGAMLLLGGIAAHAAIGAFLMRPLAFWEMLVHTKDETAIGDSDKINHNVEDAGIAEKDDDVVIETVHGSLLRVNSMTSQMSNRSRTISILGETVSASQMELNELQHAMEERVEPKLGSNPVMNCFKKVNRIFQFTLLKEPPFLIHLIVSCCGFVGYVLSYALIPSYALDLGIERSLAYFMISIGGFGDLPGRYVLSYIADKWVTKPYGEKYHIMSISMLISGLNTTLLAFSTSYSALCVHIVFIGFFGGGGFIGANIAVLKDIIGLTKCANGGIGIMMFVSGIFIGVLPPLMGLMRDSMGSFRIPFIIIGVTMMFGGCFTWLQVLAKRSQKKKRETVVSETVL